MNNTKAILQEEQLKNALAHYEKAGSSINEWRSDIPKAIELFYSEKQYSDLNEPGWLIIKQERLRQINGEKYSNQDDDQYQEGELANAGATYAMTDEMKSVVNDWGNDYVLNFWPFDLNSWKPSPDDRIKELAKAGALIAAEIDRLKRLE